MFADEQFLKNKPILTTALAYSLGVDGWSYNRRQCLVSRFLKINLLNDYLSIS